MKNLICYLLTCSFAWGSLVYAETSDDTFQIFAKAYEDHGGDRYMINEEIIQRSHVLQTAYIASTLGAPEEIVIGLLVHDIGQIICPESLGNVEKLHEKHDEYGAEWLKDKGFPEKVVNLVRYHTLAKVIFCEEIPQYYEHLSQASKDSYFIQKEKYNSSQEYRSLVAAFKKDPCESEYKAARLCDEMAKIANFNAYDDDSREDRSLYFHPPGFEYYRAMFQRVLQGSAEKASDPNWILKIKFLYNKMVKERDDFEQLVRLGSEPLLLACELFDQEDPFANLIK